VAIGGVFVFLRRAGSDAKLLLIFAPFERPLFTRLSRSRRVSRTAGVGQLPTKSPIVCLGSDSRQWGLKTYGKS
jgi:hypothetical protein